MNPVMFNIGSIEVRWYSFLILVAILLAIVLMIKEGKKYGIGKDVIFDMCFYCIIVGIIGARAYYVIFNYKEYSTSLLDIFKIWNGGLAIHGGIIAGLVTLILYCKKHNLQILRMTDIFVVSLILAQAIGRWGNFFNSEAHGRATSLYFLRSLHIPKFIIDGMNIGGVYYHPTFLYESLWCLLGFIILLIIRKFKHIKVGTLTCCYIIWYSVGRLFIESLRTDSLMLGGFKVAQIVSIIGIIISIGILFYNSKKGKYEDMYHVNNI
ncbi:MAG: prolipoprotein diacylglyceryl transferase [Bacilli bacterium]|nr:prolipoprotein diacylglyceryl transferase [Bacilli bacterium]